ncbi:MAG: hypothetical protein Q8O89_00715 [Nanoarchaeota archaeon]|nr:hypothetical protein [Nanoarchaeota archaeon]
MDDLESIIEKDCGNECNKDDKKSFFNTLKKESLSTGRLYLDVIRKPSLLAKGIYYVAKDICYELPKSLIQKKSTHENLEKRLNENASQALALSEAINVPGTYAGVGLFKMFGADDYTASIIGGSVGSYISGALSYIIAYAALTRGNKEYSLKDSLIDSCKVVKDCFPTAIALYASQAPIISGLLAAGMPRNIAVGINLAGGTAIFTGVAKYSAAQNIKTENL